MHSRCQTVSHNSEQVGNGHDKTQHEQAAISLISKESKASVNVIIHYAIRVSWSRSIVGLSSMRGSLLGSLNF